MELQAHKSPVSETSDTLTYGSLDSQLENDQKLPPDFLQNYVLGTNHKTENKKRDYFFSVFVDSDTDTDATKLQEPDKSTQTFGENVKNRVAAFMSTLRGHFESLVPKIAPSGAVRVLDVERERSAIEEFKTITVPKDPFISPYLASDDVLTQLPPVKILVRARKSTMFIVTLSNLFF